MALGAAAQAQTTSPLSADSHSQWAPVRIGVLAHRGADLCRAQREPTAEYLSRQLQGLHFVIVPLDFDAINRAVQEDAIDFVVANSSMYVKFEILYGASRIVTRKMDSSRGPQTLFGGVIFCRADRSDLQTLADLKGRRFMAVDEDSLGGWHAAWREFKDHGLNPQRDFASLCFGGTHDAVVRAVIEGKVDAGTARTDTLEDMQNRGQIRIEQLRILHSPEKPNPEFPFVHSTRLYPEWPVAKMRKTPRDLAEKVAVALMRMPADSPAARANQCAGWSYPHNYEIVTECLKELRISPYEDYGRTTLSAAMAQHWQWVTAIAVLLILALLLSARISYLNVKTRSSRDFLQSVLDASPDATLVMDLGLRVQMLNRAARQRCGANPVAMKASCEDVARWAQLPCERPGAPCPIPQIASDKKPITTYGSVRGDCGQSVDFEISMTPIFNKTGQVTHVVKSCRDITERRSTEQALRESEEKFRAISDSAQDAILMMDPQGRISYWNKAAEQILGWTAGEAMGRDLHALLAPQRFHEAHAKGFAAFIHTGQGAAIGKTLDLSAIRKNGEELPAEISINAVRLNGQYHAVGILRDVTARKRMEQALREQKDFLQTLMDSIPNPVFYKNTEGVYLGCNKAFEDYLAAPGIKSSARPFMISPPGIWRSVIIRPTSSWPAIPASSATSRMSRPPLASGATSCFPRPLSSIASASPAALSASSWILPSASRPNN